MRKNRFLNHLILCCIAVPLWSCTDLSTLSDHRPEHQAEVAPVVAGGRALSEKKSSEIIQAAGNPASPHSHELEQLVDAVRAKTNSPLVVGNKVTPLVDGPDTFAHLRRAIAGATRSVNVETYIFSDDKLGRDFASLLISKARAGVRVRVIFDAIGSLTSSDALFDEMRNAGVLVKEFNPLSFHSVAFWKFNNRDHRKLLIVDGKIAFTGGLNISGTYASKSSLHPGPERGINEGWRDTDAQIEGPAVRLFQMIFFETWAALDGEMNDSKDIDYPPLENAGDDIVSAVASTGVKQRKEPIYSTYLAAIQHASKQVWITQAYFSPPPELRDALIAAVARGVDVRVLVPSFTDSSIVFYAARGGYEPLLKHGVRLYEVTDALLHAKTAVIDGSVSIIGSANFDYRSFLHNNEVTAIIVSESLGTRMQEIYLSDLQQSKEIDINTWRRRSAGEKLKESASRLINYWL
jgi:cardiolipin synthase